MKIDYLIRRFFEEGPKVGLGRIAYRLTSPRRKASIARWMEKHRKTEISDDAFFRDLGFRSPTQPADRMLLIQDLDNHLARRGPFPLDGHQRIQQLAKLHPKEREQTLHLADAILAGDFSWLVPGVPPSPGLPPWHRAYGKGEGQDWPICPPEELHPDNAPGDIRLSWEIARQQYLIHLAHAWLYTGDSKYGKAVVTHILDWIEHNPFGMGIHWWHAQESALRIKAWLWSLGAVLSCPEIREEDRLRIYKSLWQQTAFALRTRSAAPVTHNHLLSEILGTSQFISTFPRFSLSRKWEATVLKEIATQIEKQFWEDGSPGEGSVNYHLFVLESAIEWYAHRNRLQLPIEERTKARIRSMTMATCAWVRPDGSWPQVGDVDSGRGFRLSTVPASRRQGTLDAACRLMKVLPGSSETPSPEAIWLLEKTEEADPINAQQKRELPSPRQGGIFGVHGRGEKASHITFATGPLAFRKGVSLSHLHAHGLSLSWWVDGQNILIDPGTGHYNLSLEERFAFRKSRHHSTLAVDGEDQFNVSSMRFGVERPRLSRQVEDQRGTGWRWLGARTHASTSPSSQHIQIERHIVHVPDAPALLIFDLWEEGQVQSTDQPAPFEQWFHFGGLHSEPKSDGGGVTLSTAQGEAIAECHLAHTASSEIIKGDLTTWGPGTYSPSYGVVLTGETLLAKHARQQRGGTSSQCALAPPGSSLKKEKDSVSLFLAGSDTPLIKVKLNSEGRPLQVCMDSLIDDTEPQE